MFFSVRAVCDLDRMQYYNLITFMKATITMKLVRPVAWLANEGDLFEQIQTSTHVPKFSIQYIYICQGTYCCLLDISIICIFIASKPVTI